MPAYYIYLISSLPMLNFGAKPPFSYAQFLELCEGKVTPRELALLEKVSLSAEYLNAPRESEALKQWYSFDRSLRNELVRIRSARKQKDAAKYLRADGYSEPAFGRIAMNASRIPSLLEAERALDLARWQMLDALAQGHYFDFEILIIYALKLLLLGRWQAIRAADQAKLLEEAMHQ